MAATTKHPSAADQELKLETEIAEATGAKTPTAWWQIGLVVLMVVVVVLLALQYLGGNKGTDVYPGTPVAAPQGVVSH